MDDELQVKEIEREAKKTAAKIREKARTFGVSQMDKHEAKLLEVSVKAEAFRAMMKYAEEQYKIQMDIMWELLHTKEKDR